jgi:hypothetical protein
VGLAARNPLDKFFNFLTYTILNMVITWIFMTG